MNQPGIEASQAGLTETIRRVTDQGLLVIGSIGRAAYFNEHADNWRLEFDQQDQDPLVSRDYWGRLHPRDVDVLGGTPSGSLESYGLHPPDSVAFDGTALSVRIVKDGAGDWWLHGRGASRQLDPTIFEPVEGRTVFGEPCRTVRPSTQLLLVAAFGYWDRKQRKVEELIQQHFPESEEALLHSPPYELLTRRLFYAARQQYEGF